MMQISQMIAGVFITVMGFIYARDPSTCVGVVPNVLYFQGLIYSSYLYLFLEFMIKRFFLKTPASSTKKVGAPALANGNGHLKKAQ